MLEPMIRECAAFESLFTLTLLCALLKIARRDHAAFAKRYLMLIVILISANHGGAREMMILKEARDARLRFARQDRAIHMPDADDVHDYPSIFIDYHSFTTRSFNDCRNIFNHRSTFIRSSPIFRSLPARHPSR